MKMVAVYPLEIWKLHTCIHIHSHGKLLIMQIKYQYEPMHGGTWQALLTLKYFHPPLLNQMNPALY